MPKCEKIAIAGAGITGAYLYRMLDNLDYTQVTVYERGITNTTCGISPCAWGSSSTILKLIHHAGLDYHDYILRKINKIILEGIELSADIVIIDKPKLIKDLLKGASIVSVSGDGDSNNGNINFSEYDRVIDATGVERAYLPKIQNDIILNCIQFRISSLPIQPMIKLNNSKIGYSWVFPLDKNVYHIGCGSYSEYPIKELRKTGWLSISDRFLCTCKGKIRLTSPAYSRPFIYKNIWGIGEAIGCVAPLAGDGIVPGIQSVIGLMDNWYDSVGYERYILGKFYWMYDERKVLDKLIRKEDIGYGDARILKRNAERMGIYISLKDALRLLIKLRG